MIGQEGQARWTKHKQVKDPVQAMEFNSVLGSLVGPLGVQKPYFSNKCMLEK